VRKNEDLTVHEQCHLGVFVVISSVKLIFVMHISVI